MPTTTQISPDLQEFMDDLHKKQEARHEKRTEPFLEFWSHRPGASITAAVGGYHIGFDEVSKLLPCGCYSPIAVKKSPPAT